MRIGAKERAEARDAVAAMPNQPEVNWRAIQRQLVDINETVSENIRQMGVAFIKWSQTPDGQRFRESVREACYLLAKARIR